jgi:ABC-2 type transporter
MLMLSKFQTLYLFFWKELFDVFRRPAVPVILLVASVFVVWTSSRLTFERAPLHVLLYKGDATDPQLDAARAALHDFSKVEITEVDGNVVRPEDVVSDNASVAIVLRGEKWLILHELPTLHDEESSELITSTIDASVNMMRLGNVMSIATAKLNRSRMLALPGERQLELVPSTIALVIVFFPFVLAARSYSREMVFGTLQSLLAFAGGSWWPILWAKTITVVWLILVIFLLMLLIIQPMFGINPKQGVLAQITTQMLAVLFSTCLGLLTAIVVRNQSYVHVVTAVYFLILVLLSGLLFPLEQSSSLIRLVSYVNPLRFSNHVLKTWLFFGTNPLNFSADLTYLLGQCMVVICLLVGGVFFARQQI